MADWRTTLRTLMGNSFDVDRFGEAVLYVAWRMKDDAEFVRVKLAKTLFYADFEFFAEDAEPLTGGRYEHWRYGPFPPMLYDVEEDLERAGHAKRLRPGFEGDEAKRLLRILRTLRIYRTGTRGS
jgi:uncharacterized phage-associated protein